MVPTIGLLLLFHIFFRCACSWGIVEPISWSPSGCKAECRVQQLPTESWAAHKKHLSVLVKAVEDTITEVVTHSTNITGGDVAFGVWVVLIASGSKFFDLVFGQIG